MLFEDDATYRPMFSATVVGVILMSPNVSRLHATFMLRDVNRVLVESAFLLLHATYRPVLVARPEPQGGDTFHYHRLATC